MATVREYFDKGPDLDEPIFPIRSDWVVDLGAISVKVTAKLHLNFGLNAKYMSFFVPKSQHVGAIVLTIIDSPQAQVGTLGGDEKSGEDGLKFETTLDLRPKRIHQDELVYTRRIFLYSEQDLTEIEQKIDEHAATRGLHVILKGPVYAKQRSEYEKPKAFVSHDSRDKDELVRPLALKLQSSLCPVWYDEFSLKLGDNLRESIDRGLKDAKYCILVLSKNFMANDGWGKAEFDSIYMREIMEKEDVILPVWHGVSAAEVYEYNARLANKVGISSDCGIDELANTIVGRIKW